MNDNRNTELEVGQEVAYNLSGEIAKGVIESIKSKPRKSCDEYDIRVRLLHNACGQKAGHISKVRNPRNVLVIKESK